MLESALLPFASSPTSPAAAAGNPASSSSPSSAPSSTLTLSDLHDLLRYLPPTRRHLAAVRCVSKPWRYVVESAPNLPWAGNGKIYIAKGGQTVIYNAKRCSNDRPLVLADGTTTITDNFSFALYNVSPVGRKVSDFCVRVLARNFEQCSRGLTVLHLHYATVTPASFEILGQIDTLQELQFVSCRGMTHLGEAKHCRSLRSLEATLCHLEARPLEGLFLPNLRYLKLSRSTQLETLHGAAEETFASLRYLCVEDCPMLADDGCEEIFPWLQHIEHLDLSFTNICYAVLQLPLEGKRRLKTLALTNTCVVSELFEQVAPDLRQLEILRVDSCESLASLSFLEMGGTITQGEIEENPEVGPGGFLTLNVLDLSHNDSSHYDAISALRRLQALRLVACNDLYSTYIAPLSRTIVSLDVSHSSANDNLVTTVGTMRLLESLNVSHCAEIRSLAPLQHCKRLKRLFAAETRVDNRGIRQLSGCEALEELDLSGLLDDEDEYGAPADDMDLSHLCDLPNLKTVNVFRSMRSEVGFARLQAQGVMIISELIYGGAMEGA